MVALITLMQELFPSEPRGIATLSDQERDGFKVAFLPSGDEILLRGTAQAGETVFFSRATNKILEPAPAVAWTDIAV